MSARHAGSPRRATRTSYRPDSFGRTIGWTVGVVVVPAMVLVAAAYVAYRIEGVSLARIAVVPRALQVIAVGAALGLVCWLMLLLTTYLRVRPLRPTRGQRYAGSLLTMVLGILITAPLSTTSYYAVTQINTLNAIVTNEQTATVPTLEKVTKKNPWGTKDRVNILLLGGDGGVGRAGIRTDTVILVSVDTRTGRATMFSLPRNLRDVPFPPGSKLAELYPNGFEECCTDGESMLNAIYRNVPAKHPGALGRSDNEGADAVKLGVSGALGVPVDYYVLVNLDGFRQIVRAIGGITVNVNERVAINGNSSRGIPPTDWIEPGPNQHLDGFHALWFTRGRYGSTDYKRMERQRCAIKAIVDEASPGRLLARYIQLASATKQILRTDIPQSVLPAFVDLALKMKDSKLTSVVFQNTSAFDPNDPDFDTVHAAVTKALSPAGQASGGASGTPSGTPSDGASDGASGGATDGPTGSPSGSPSDGGDDASPIDQADTASACTYQPEG